MEGCWATSRGGGRWLRGSLEKFCFALSTNAKGFLVKFTLGGTTQLTPLEVEVRGPYSFPAVTRNAFEKESQNTSEKSLP
eukprot:3352136-Rhodomonas_salina.1